MDDEINLIEYWDILVKHKILVAVFVVIGFFISSIYNSIQPVYYKATVTVLSRDSGAGSLISSAVSLFGGVGGSSAENKLIPILKSRNLAYQVVKASEQSITAFPREFLVDEYISAIDVKSSDGLYNLSIIWPNRDEAILLANKYEEELGKFLSDKAISFNILLLDPAVSASPFKKKRIDSKVGALIGFLAGVVLALYVERKFV